VSDGEILDQIRSLLGAGGGTEAAAALAFYADPSNWKPQGDPFSPTPAPVALDKGELARKALGKPAPKKKIGKGGRKDSAPPPTPAPAPPKKGKKGKKQDPEPDEGDRPPARPPARMVTLQCQHCPKTQEILAGMVPQRFDESGKAEPAPWVCGRCIKERKHLAK
jgi:hypothetical protein